MEWVETTGRTVAEALDAALDQLGVDEQDAEVQIVEEPQKGLFGRLRSEARVRARVRPTRPRPKTERRDRRRRGEREKRGRGSAAGASADAGGGGRKAGGATKVAASNRKDAEPANGASEPAESEGDNGAESGGGTRKRRRRRGNRSKQQGATVTNVRDESTGTEASFDLDAQKDAVEEFLEGLMEALGRPEATVTMQVVEEDTIEADVEGDELGLLVGPKGQTLQALHELVRSMVQRQFVGQAHARVRLDVGGYRLRRREALERFTQKVAEEVIASGEAKRLEPMAASDRKVVHDTANEIAGIKTISEGEEPARRVVIQPE